MRVDALFIHPVKACAAIEVAEAEVGDRGFENDRRFLLVRPDGEFVTQREDPRLALLRVAIEPRELVLSAPSLAPEAGELRVPIRVEAAPARTVRVWGDEVVALDAGEQAAAWLRRVLGAEIGLVFMPDSARRPVEQSEPHGAIVSFADAHPFLVVGSASLAAVEERAPGTGVALRFRPNLVIGGLAAFAEDDLPGVTIGPIELRFVKACSRCTVVDVDPATAVVGREPLASLAAFRKIGGKVLFGQDAVHQGRGTIRVGDAVRPMAAISKLTADS